MAKSKKSKTKRDNLTDRQRAVYRFIRELIHHRGYGPTVREIASKFEGRDIWVVILTSSLVAAMLLDDREIGRRVGATMVIGYIAYMSFLYYSTT